MPHELQAFPLWLVKPRTSAGSVWAPGNCSPYSFGVILPPDFDSFLTLTCHQHSRNALCRSLERSPCAPLLFCTLPCGFEPHSLLKLLLLSPQRRKTDGSASLCFGLDMLSRLTWDRTILEFTSFVSALSGTPILCIQIAMSKTRCFKMYFVLRFSYFMQEVNLVPVLPSRSEAAVLPRLP